MADVVLIEASRLVNEMFEGLMQWTRKARLIGLYGLDGSLIPDVFLRTGLTLSLRSAYLTLSGFPMM